MPCSTGSAESSSHLPPIPMVSRSRRVRRYRRYLPALHLSRRRCRAAAQLPGWVQHAELDRDAGRAVRLRAGDRARAAHRIRRTGRSPRPGPRAARTRRRAGRCRVRRVLRYLQPADPRPDPHRHGRHGAASGGEVSTDLAAAWPQPRVPSPSRSSTCASAPSSTCPRSTSGSPISCVRWSPRTANSPRTMTKAYAVR